MSQAALCSYISEHKPGMKLKVASGAISCVVFVFSGAVVGQCNHLTNARLTSSITGLCKDQTSPIGQFDSFYQRHANIMCSIFCPCQLSHAANADDVVSPTGFVDVVNCYTDTVAVDPKFVSLAQSLETQHQCAGMC